MKGLVSWGHSFNNQHVKRLPHGLKALMFLLKQVVSLHEENVPYCFIKETLFLELLLHSGYQGVCVSSGMNLNHLHCCTQWDLTISHGLLENRGACVFHLLAIHCRLISLRLGNMMKPG